MIGPLPQKFHSLELLHYCGGGAYGDVYFCRDLSGREMAVKIISKQKLGDKWQRELKGVINYRKLTENTPSLLQLFHVEEDETSFWYTMEAADSVCTDQYLPDTLTRRLENGPLPMDTLFSTLSGIFSSIRTLHEAGFAHRDIKPDNILFVKGRPKLGDIGLLSSVSSTVTQIAGTLDFLPPELWTSDDSTESDWHSHKHHDLYAFGKVIYCSVTGKDPHAFPSIPPELPLSLPLKLFLRLSFQLCDKDPERRPVAIDELQETFSKIQRQLQYGETLRDKLSYQLKRISSGIRAYLLHFVTFTGRYWLLLVACLLLTALGTAYLLQPAPQPPAPPQPAYDITQEDTQLYTNEELGFTMTIPKQWEIVPKEDTSKILSAEALDKATAITNAEFTISPDDTSKITQRRKDFLKEWQNLCTDLIICNFNEEFADNIEISSIPLPGKELIFSSDQQLRIEARKLYQGELKYDTHFYDIKRTVINDAPCILIDLSQDPEHLRTLNCLFPQTDRTIRIALTATKETFPRIREIFLQALNTIQFHPPQKKP